MSDVSSKFDEKDLELLEQGDVLDEEPEEYLVMNFYMIKIF